MISDWYILIPPSLPGVPSSHTSSHTSSTSLWVVSVDSLEGESHSCSACFILFLHIPGPQLAEQFLLRAVLGSSHKMSYAASKANPDSWVPVRQACKEGRQELPSECLEVQGALVSESGHHVGSCSS